jgi:hypothetical protein
MALVSHMIQQSLKGLPRWYTRHFLPQATGGRCMILKKSMISKKKKKKRFKEKIDEREIRFTRRRFKKGKGRFKCE